MNVGDREINTIVTVFNQLCYVFWWCVVFCSVLPHHLSLSPFCLTPNPSFPISRKSSFISPFFTVSLCPPLSLPTSYPHHYPAVRVFLLHCSLSLSFSLSSSASLSLSPLAASLLPLLQFLSFFLLSLLPIYFIHLSLSLSLSILSLYPSLSIIMSPPPSLSPPIISPQAYTRTHTHARIRTYLYVYTQYAYI